MFGEMQQTRFIDRGPQSAGVGKVICQDVIAGAGQPLRFIDPTAAKALVWLVGSAKMVCRSKWEQIRNPKGRLCREGAKRDEENANAKLPQMDTDGHRWKGRELILKM